MARKNNHISILRFDERQIARLRIANTTEGIDVLAFDKVDGPWSAEDGSLEQALRSFVDTHDLQDDAVYTILPRHDVTSRILTLPTQDAAEIAQMMSLSAAEYVPYPADELVIDQAILESLPSGEAKVMVVLAHQDVVNAHVDTLQRVGVTPEEVLLSSSCLAAVGMHEEIEGDAPVAFIDLASGGIEILVLEKGQLVYTRGVAADPEWNPESLAEPSPELIEELGAEIRGSLLAYRRESEEGHAVEQVFLASPASNVTPAAEKLAEILDKSCKSADFALSLITNGKEHLSGLPLVFFGAVLAVQSRASISFELLPDYLKQGRKFKDIQKKFMQGALCAVLVLLGFGALYMQAVSQRQAVIGDLDQQLALIEPSALSIASKQEKLQILAREVEYNGTILELLAKISEAAGEWGINVTRLAFDSESGIDMWGRTKSLDNVSKFNEMLRGIKDQHLQMFAQAQLAYDEADRERDKSIVLYKVTIPIEETEETDGFVGTI
jgi:hypothetical protein